MTWHHVAALLIAAMMVIVCGVSEKCAPSFPHVISLATAIVAGAFGHAGAQARQVRKTDQPEPEQVGRGK